MHVLFVCSGNTCRSPMAEYLLRAKAAARNLPWTAESAGLHAWPGLPMTEAAQTVLARRQIEAGDHRSQRVTDQAVERADVVLTMTRAQAAELRDRYPQAAGKIHELGAFVRPPEAPADAACDIVDPFGGSVEQYEVCAAALETLVERLLAQASAPAAGAEAGPAGSEGQGDADRGGATDESGHCE
ncbi:MAG: low molecular weight protein arginine phosphatase [Alicyclobacillaceae bacterium]|nr:low molecular weight protein arginine phosphatase [Alicyclobacillaceae bacterium]